MPLPDIPPMPPMDRAVPVSVLLSAERVAVTDGATMGLAGLQLRRAITPQTWGGVAVFGATQGDRGGFFGWGVSGGTRWRDGPWQAEAGLFVGGAGGSPGWVGGGLMLRPQVAVAHAWGPLSLGLGWSQVWFPNGRVRSQQPYASLDWTTDSALGPAGGGLPFAADPGLAAQAMPTETAALVGRYAMGGRSARRDGLGPAGDLRYGGLVFRRALPGRLAGAQPYWLLSAAGGLSGAYAGYAELLGGVGAVLALPSTPFALRAEAALGSGGAGASADTGGGLLAKASAGATWQLSPQLSLSASVGRVASAGPFKPRDTRLELAYRGWDLVPGDLRAVGPAPQQLAWTPWTLSAGWLQATRLARDDGSAPGAGLVALKLEREFGPQWRLTGQAAIAATGGAGGYASGHLGLGWLTAPQPDSRWRWGAEASVGAAGGGSVRVGNGLIGQAQLQARLALSPQWALQADAGWLRGSALSTPVLGLGAVYAFSRLQGL